MININIETLPLSQLQPAALHPRTMPDAEREKLRRSIETYGCVELIIWNRRSGQVVSGRQRLDVLQALGENETRCVVVDLDDDNERALALAMNKIGGAFDEAKLLEAMAAFSADFDATLSGFDMAEIRELMTAEIQPQQDDFDFDAALEEVGEPVTQPGNVWILGDHRLLCGDATDVVQMGQLMPGEATRLVLTDPPWGVGYAGKAGTITNDNLSDSAFRALLKKAFRVMGGLSAPGAAIYVFHPDSQAATFREAMDHGGFGWHQGLVWVKSHFVLGHRDYHEKYECIAYGWAPGAPRYFANDRTQATVLEDAPPADPRKLKKEELIAEVVRLRAAQDQPSSVIRADKPARSEMHPTMKPIPLLGQLIRNSSRPGDIVLDPFAGSGSTLIACEQLQRRTRCTELEPRYCDCIVQRWEAATGRKAVLER